MDNFLDHYCERVSPQLWDEPLNFLTNAAFLIVAFIVLRKLLKIPEVRNRQSWDLWLLASLIVTVGAGSGIWHLLATGWALWADRLPILLFISLFLVSCLVRIFKLNVVLAIISLVIFQITIQFKFPPATLNGSLFYIPTMIFLLAMAIILLKQKNPTGNKFLIAFLLFSVAIVFRTVDLAICDSVPVGTHFLWHLLIAMTIYPLMTALIQSALLHHIYEK